jgi:hypothetical protein
MIRAEFRERLNVEPTLFALLVEHAHGAAAADEDGPSGEDG